MADRQRLQAFIGGAAELFLGVSNEEVQAVCQKDGGQDGDRVIEKFFSSEAGAVNTLFFYNAPTAEGTPGQWTLGGEPRDVDCSTAPCLVLAKVDPSVPLNFKEKDVRRQVHVHTLPQGSIFDCFAQLVTGTFEPRMSVEVEQQPRRNRERAAVMHSMEELLVNLSDQTTMVVPDVKLDKHIHEVILQKCTAYKEASAPDIASKVQAEKQSPDKHWDTEFVQACYRCLNSANKDIKSVVEMEAKRKTSVLTNARDEIQFWKNLSDALSDIQRQLGHKGWAVQIDLLRRSGRIFLTGVQALEVECGLQECSKNVREYLHILHDFPVNKLLQAKSIDAMSAAVTEIYDHIRKHLKTTKFPVLRIMNLIDAVTRDFNKQLLKLLSPQGLLDLDFDDFERETRGCEVLFSDWTTSYRRFNEDAKKQARRQQGTGKSAPSGVQMGHLPLKQRIECVITYRRGHQKFVQVLKEVMPAGQHPAELGGGQMDALAEMAKAYDSVKTTVGDRLLDVTDDGQCVWDRAHRTYEDRVNKVEEHITEKLKDRLTNAQTATEMFRVFSKFNPLTSNRQKIRSAIQQYQGALILKVSEDVQMLREKFTDKYEASEARSMARVRDVPKVSGNIIWAKSIERQLHTLMKRVEDVYGKGWDRLKGMRKKGDGTAGVSWTLDEQLADFVGAKMERLERKAREALAAPWSRFADQAVVSGKEKDLKTRIMGTAIALAFLETVFQDSRSEWQQLAEEGMDSLRKMERQLDVDSGYDAIRGMLRDIGVANQHVEGASVRKDGQSFGKKIEDHIKGLMKNWNDLMTRMIYQEWDVFVFTDKETEQGGAPGARSKRVDVQGPIFKIVKGSDGDCLVVNFDPGIVGLIKEVQAMHWLNMMRVVEFQIAETAIAAKEVYPHAMALVDSTRTFQKDVATVDKSRSMLLQTETTEVYSAISAGLRLSWEKELELNKVSRYSRQLHEAVTNYHRRLEEVNKGIARIDECVERVQKCDPGPAEFKAIFKDLQKILDDLSLREYANLALWVNELDKRVSGILAGRLTDILQGWTQQFKRLGDQEETAPQDDDPEEEEKKKKKKKLKFHLTPVVLDLKVQKGIMTLDPSLDRARMEWTQRLQKVLSWILTVPKLQAARFDYDEGSGGDAPATYRDILGDVPEGVVYEAFACIDTQCENAYKYYEDWTKLQALWEMELDRITDLCGNDLKKWLDLLQDIRESKSMTDTSETSKDFGAIIVNYKFVQDKVSVKYDETNHKLIVRFASLVAGSKTTFYEQVHEERMVLEKMDFAADAKNMSRFLTRLPGIRKRKPKWEAEDSILCLAEKELKRAKFKFPTDWQTFDWVHSEWEAFNQALSDREEDVLKRKEQLQRFVIDMDKTIEESFQQLKKEWQKNRPVGPEKHTDALDTIGIYQERVQKLQEEFREVCEAKDALDMDVRDLNKMDSLCEDVESLREVWGLLAGVHKELEDLGETVWNQVQARKLMGQLREIESRLQQFPSSIRTYSAWVHLNQLVEGYCKVNPIIAELRSEALKERHWHELQKLLRDAEGFDNIKTLTLGKVWAADLQKYQSSFQQVIRQAQGEMALEEFLAQVKTCWTDMELEMVTYRKCFLIKGWDTISEKLSEHLNSLQSMRMSPYFKQFESEGTNWEERLCRIQDLFGMPDGTWFDVQRRWVYLEGIFIGNQDIKRQLPQESQSFESVDKDFRAVMTKAHGNRYVSEAMRIERLAERLGHQARALTAIQKALGDYLEKQRREFPRYYFVGDDDLLEIMGHSKDPAAVQKHFKKMFAGISQLVIEQEEPDSPTAQGKLPILHAMESSEMENVPFKTSVDLNVVTAVNNWLKAVVTEMQEALRVDTSECFKDTSAISKNIDEEKYTALVDKYPTQVLELAGICEWTRMVEDKLRGLKGGGGGLDEVHKNCVDKLSALAHMVLFAGDRPIRRKRIEILISALVYQRDATGRLMQKTLSGDKDFDWLVFMRFYPRKSKEGKETVFAEIADACLPYSYEYLGVGDRLVQTPLTDKCYLTLTQALHTRMGGAPAGPAGTGKTETTKALGTALGRFVLVFCCDEAFDFKAMGRIFVGLCQVGAWGCFDEFNRLEERILSAVSQQIQIVQEGLAAGASLIRLLDRDVPLHYNVGIFITMNPGYAGRSALPDNLKQLFRPVAMSAPDREIIAEVMLFSCGFQQARALSRKVVPLFQLCKDQLSLQGHYDFGLRALKGTLVNAGNMKREEFGTAKLSPEQELQIALKSITKTVEPKLVADDISLFRILCNDVFPGVELQEAGMEELIGHAKKICAERHLVCSEQWLHKVLQVFSIQRIHHGLMLVGPSCSGKTTAWSTLLLAMSRLYKKEGVAYVMDPKAVSKAELYGAMDPTTREWTDGIFTATLRRIVDNTSGDDHKKIHWIIFDGDVDPEWVENLNSLLDDNKLLTLPNGERLQLPSNVKVVFEVQDLRAATPATVSRCGMVWFSADVCTTQMALHHYVDTLLHKHVENTEMPPLTSTSKYEATVMGGRKAKSGDDDEDDEEAVVEETPMFGGGNQQQEMVWQQQYVKHLKPLFAEGGFVSQVVEVAVEILNSRTIMEWCTHQYLTSLKNIINQGILNLIEHNSASPEFPLEEEALAKYVPRRLIFALVWGMAGGCNLESRTKFCDRLGDVARQCGLSGHVPGGLIIDYDVQISNGDWVSWQDSVPHVDIPPHKVGTNDVIINTVDTVRHEEVVMAWLQSHRPMIFCGPPGSGKTMTLTGVLRRLTDYEPIFLNFSSGSLPEMIHKTFDHPSFQYTTAPGIGPVVRPNTPGKWIVIFCDECNLPAADTYGTQRIVALMRQIIERKGFYRTLPTGELQWTTVQRVQFAGACNPPTDPGRVPMSHRFLRYAPLLYVDYPARQSLEQIYGTFCRAFVRPLPPIRDTGDALAAAMVDFYLASQKNFTPEMQSHYVYSPRELSRWTRAVFEGLNSLDFAGKQGLSVEQLVRLSVHEGLRLFRDRLLLDNEKEWTDEQIDKSFSKSFPSIDAEKTFARPILYSTMLNKEYSDNHIDDIRKHIQGKLKVFAEEEMDVQLVVFDSVVEHILRIDRIIRQPLGHMLLVGVAGAGKTVLSKFVSWHSGMTIFQIKAHRAYTIQDFEEDLRQVLKRAGTKGERICFIFDESNVMDSGFLEYMNALLASGEVPGLFEGTDYDQLMTAARDGINALPGAKTIDTSDKNAMYKWFVQQVQINLHVIFTMNPNSPDFHNRCQTSPALFNRCTIDWFGEWSDTALMQVASEYTEHIDVMESQDRMFETPEEAHGALASSIVRFHHHVVNVNDKLRRKGAGRGTFITPRHYLDFIQQFKALYKEKRGDVQEQQMHLNTGLSKLEDTAKAVGELRTQLEQKEKELNKVQEEAKQKMSQLQEDQAHAGQEQEKASAMKKALEQETTEIDKRQAQAKESLAQAEPTLEKAKAAVSSIPEKDLREIRQYAKPPATVERVMQMVVIMQGHKKTDWKSVKEIMQKDGFLRDLVNFDSSKITEAAKNEVTGPKFLGDPKFDTQTAYKASKAAGPLYDWTHAQILYAKILLEIKPLTTEIAKLNEQMKEKQTELEKTEARLVELQKSVQKMAEEYRELAQREAQLQIEQKDTTQKFDRATNLLQSLEGERLRWGDEKKNFAKQITTIVGDTLLGGGFLAYNGYFDDYHRRSVILPKWMRALKDRKVSFKKHLSLMEYLSHPHQRLKWQSHGLPLDELYVENAVILSRYQRYPLIIDPSGTAVAFLMSHFKEANIHKTSFLEDGFMKSLETALRFGYPLLVQDVECIDPILNPILNREVSKQGGRVLVRLGESSIDLSPAFKLFLSTRDSSFQFAPDISGRVTFANFTVTPGSLMNQCLQHTLEVERPEVQQQRAELMKAQGEYKLRQKLLEEELLNEISKAEGNILENNALIKQLKVIKETTADIKEKLDKTDETMAEIKKVEKQFRNVADASSKLYFMLQQLIDLNPLYTSSLTHFMQILDDVLRDRDGLLPPTDAPEARRSILLRQLFQVVYEHQSRAMMQKDHHTFALRLCQVRLALKNKAADDDAEEQNAATDVPKELWEILLATGQSRGGGRMPKHVPEGLETRQRAMLGDVLALPVMEKVAADMDANPRDWQNLVSSSDAIKSLPASVRESVGKQDNSISKALRELVVLKVFRPDALKEQATNFVSVVFDGLTSDVSTPKPQRPFLDTAVPQLGPLSDSGGPYAPLLLCSAPGFDASDRVQGLAKERKKTLREIAMGSPEGYEDADRAFYASMSSGDWVLLKNVHLAPQYLSSLEKKLHAQQLERKGDQQFRIFLTSEISPKLPSNLLRRSHVLVFEPSNGLRPNLLRAVDKHRVRQAQQGQDMKKEPVELPRLHFLAAWLHAIIMERLRYTPLGWTKKYEISEGHFRRTVDTIDAWVGRVAEGRTTVPVQSLPWRALFVLLGESVYGGGIDNDFDGYLLKSFLSQFFTPDAFGPGFKLTGPYEGQKPLEITRDPSQQSFDDWVRNLPETQTPVWLGLPGLSQKMIQTQQGQAMLIDLVKIQDLFEEGEGDDDEEEAPSPPGSPGNWQKKRSKGPADTDSKDVAYLPEWARKLKDTVDGWLAELVDIDRKRMHVDLWDKEGSSPIAQALRREVEVAEKLCKQVRRDMHDVIDVCTGESKPTNIVRDLMGQLGKEIIPPRWKKYTVPPAMTVSPWVGDFAKRCQLINSLGAVCPADYAGHEINMGMLLYPGAFITATRQAVARKLKYPLEKLVLSVDVTKGAEGPGDTDSGGSFLISGLGLQGMQLADGRLNVLRDALKCTLGTHRLWWRTQESHTVSKDALTLPLYLNYARTELLAKLELPINKQTPAHEWYQMGAAVTAWSEP
eukprot:TRINITY_DN7156_c0_g1_i1.p1 TRINITY_DN7156_c0_g1~~TRINITY_DN7156_c0_g1_i1.p1  ORF type:complete len:4841 (+),score=1881.44 TRINITY_DN7156_c0_g1_i1:123-14645(+)